MTAAALYNCNQRIGPGRVVLVVGPSGAGKDTLIGVARAKLGTQEGERAGIRFPRRFVTREASAAEDNLVVSSAEFDDLIARNELALHWHAHGAGYGIGVDVDREVQVGATVVINISRGVVAAARLRYVHVEVVYIDAPAEVRLLRIAKRGREQLDAMSSRLPQVSQAFCVTQADLVIVNDCEPEIAGQHLYKFITARSTD